MQRIANSSSPVRLWNAPPLRTLEVLFFRLYISLPPQTGNAPPARHLLPGTCYLELAALRLLSGSISQSVRLYSLKNKPFPAITFSQVSQLITIAFIFGTYLTLHYPALPCIPLIPGPDHTRTCSLEIGSIIPGSA